jgi:hypothetical protein
MTPVSTKLREARALIERGWTQGLFSKDGCYCAAGAILALGVDTYNPLTRQFAELSGVGTTALDVVRWNDNYLRTQTDVLAAFDRAIELAEQEAR